MMKPPKPDFTIELIDESGKLYLLVVLSAIAGVIFGALATMAVMS